MEHSAWQRANQYVGKPWSLKEWGYACVKYTIRPQVTGERRKRVVAELTASHTYFGSRWDRGGVLVIYVD